MRRSAVPLALAFAALSASSCGLIDPDVTDFNLKLPEKSFNVDTADWMLTVTEASMPTIDCSATDCTAAADMFCAEDHCTADCDASSHCQAHVDVSVFQPFDLANESPELAEISYKPIAKVTVESIAFKIN